MRPAVFLDRDDTLLRRAGGRPTGDLGDPAHAELVPGAPEACRLLKDAGYALVVVTNQGGVARGIYTLQDVERVHEWLNQRLEGRIDAFRACPYHPLGSVPHYRAEHPWRKPAPGMLLDAADKLALDLPRSWLIGDAIRDCEAGRAAGCRTVLIATKPPPPPEPAIDFVAPDLLHAARTVLEHTPPGAGA